MTHCKHPSYVNYVTGISKTGLVEPIALNLKSNRSGLGVDEAKRRREEQAQEQRRQEELKRQRMQEQGKELYVQVCLGRMHVEDTACSFER